MHIKKDGVLPMTSHSHPLAFTRRNSVGTDTNAARADGLKTSYMQHVVDLLVRSTHVYRYMWYSYPQYMFSFCVRNKQ